MGIYGCDDYAALIHNQDVTCCCSWEELLVSGLGFAEPRLYVDV